MAQASGKDARDILNLPERTQASPSPAGLGGPPSSSRPPVAPRPNGPPTLKKAAKAKGRTDGIHKELQALFGDNAPSLAVAHSEAKAMLGAEAGRGYRPKFKRKERKARHWHWTTFTNDARRDGLSLGHWTPDDADADASAEGKGKYPHSVFNTSSGVYSYSNEEYQQHLKDDDWSKEETDHLIDLCQMYDLRFVIIADRWDRPATAHKHRTMEDLKTRYYAICRRLIRSRISVDDMESRQQLLQTYAFDKAREVERKKLLQRLFTRTPAQLAEEEALYVEARRLEQNEAKFSAEREDLLKLLGGWERVPNVSGALIAESGAGIGPGSAATLPGTPGSAMDESSLSDSAASKRKRRRTAMEGGALLIDDDAASTSARSTAGGGGGGAVSGAPTSVTLTSKQKAELKQALNDELQCITRFDADATPLARPPYPFLVGTPSTSPPVAPSPHNPSSAHGVYLRSARVLTPRQPQLNRTMQTLAEMNPPIGPRLIFPTRQNCEKWEGLLGAVTSGLEMKKQTDRVESELRIAKSRLAGLMAAAKDKERERVAGGRSGSVNANGNASGQRASSRSVGSASMAARRSVSVTPRSGGSTVANAGSGTTSGTLPTSVPGVQDTSSSTGTSTSTMAVQAAKASGESGATEPSKKERQKGLVGHDSSDDDDDDSVMGGEDAESGPRSDDKDEGEDEAADEDEDDEDDEKDDEDEWKDAKEGDVMTKRLADGSDEDSRSQLDGGDDD